MSEHGRDSELRPCPFCGHESPRLVFRSGCGWVRCDECKCFGPYAFDSDEAREKWGKKGEIETQETTA